MGGGGEGRLPGLLGSSAPATPTKGGLAGLCAPTPTPPLPPFRCLWLAGLAVATSPRRCNEVRLVCGASRRWGGGRGAMWPRWEVAGTWLQFGPRDSPEPCIDISLIKAERKQIRFQAAARCCLPPLLSTRRRDCCPPGSVPKGVVLEGRWRGGKLAVRGLETRLLEREGSQLFPPPRPRPPLLHSAPGASGQLPPRPRASR